MSHPDDYQDVDFKTAEDSSPPGAIGARGQANPPDSSNAQYHADSGIRSPGGGEVDSVTDPHGIKVHRFPAFVARRPCLSFWMFLSASLFLSMLGLVLHPFSLEAGGTFYARSDAVSVANDAFKTRFEGDPALPEVPERTTRDLDLTVVFEALEGEDLVAEGLFEEVVRLERLIREHASYDKHCAVAAAGGVSATGKPCLYIESLALALATGGVSANDSSSSSSGSGNGTGGVLLPQPTGAERVARLEEIAQVLSNSTLPISDSRYPYMSDKVAKTFLPGSPVSRVLRVTVPMGLPLAGFRNTYDRLVDQQDIYGEWIETLTDMLREEAASDRLKNRVGVYWAGEVVTGQEIQRLIFQDLFLLSASILIVGTVMMIHTWSVFLTLLGLFQILLCFPLAYFVYSIIFRIEIFTGLNTVAIFIVLGVGVDDCLVAINTWKQSRHNPELKGDLETRFSVVWATSAKAMLVTSLTTFVAFIASAASTIPAIRTFGVFAAISVLINYLLVITLFAPVLIMYHNYFEFKYCCCCGDKWAEKRPTSHGLTSGTGGAIGTELQIVGSTTPSPDRPQPPQYHHHDAGMKGDRPQPVRDRDDNANDDGGRSFGRGYSSYSDNDNDGYYYSSSDTGYNSYSSSYNDNNNNNNNNRGGRPVPRASKATKSRSVTSAASTVALDDGGGSRTGSAHALENGSGAAAHAARDPDDPLPNIDDFGYVERIMHVTVAPLIRKFRYPIVGLFTVLFIVSVVWAVGLKPPVSQDSGLPDGHPLKSIQDLQSEFRGAAVGGRTEGALFVWWGIEDIERSGDPNDSENPGLPVFSPDFDVSSEAAQSAVLTTCRELAANRDRVDEGRNRCPMEGFSEWISANGTRLPGVNATVTFPVPKALFNPLFEVWANTPEANAYLDLFGWNDASRTRVKWIAISFVPTVSFQDTQATIKDHYKYWSDAVDDITDRFSGTGIGTCRQTMETWVWMRTSEILSRVAIVGLIISLSLAYVVILFLTHNIIIASITIVVLGLITAFVAGMLAVSGYDLDFNISISLSIAAGLAVDFSVHVCTAFADSPEPTRFSRTRDAMTTMVVSTSAGAVTTLCATGLMFAARFPFFRTFGSSMFVIILSSWVWSTFCLPAFLMILGPPGKQGDLLILIKKALGKA